MNSVLKTTVVVLLVSCLAAAMPSWAEEEPFQRGLDHMKAEEFEEAIRIFSLCVELIPHDYEAWYQRGLAHMLTGDDRSAESDFSRAIVLDPNFAPALANRGVIRSLNGNPAGAVDDFSRVLEIAPRNVEALCNRGAALCDSGRCGPALRDYDAAIEIDPLSARAHGFKGFALEKLGDFAGALVFYRKAIRLNPGDDASHNNLAWIMAACPHEKFRDGAEAVRLASKALEIHPEPAYLDTLAAAYAEMGLFEEALSTQEKFMVALADNASPEVIAAHRERMALYRDREPFRFSVSVPPMEPEEETALIASAPAPASPPPSASAPASPPPSVPAPASPPPSVSTPASTASVSDPAPASTPASPPAPFPVAVGAGETGEAPPRPYTIQLESRRGAEAVIAAARELRGRGMPSFTSTAHIPRKGALHRLFLGRFATVRTARGDLEKVLRLGFADAFVAKMPFTLRATPRQPGASLSELENNLLETGFLHVSRQDGADAAFLVGAFETTAMAMKSADLLKRAGFNCEIVRR